MFPPARRLSGVSVLKKLFVRGSVQPTVSPAVGEMEGSRGKNVGPRRIPTTPHSSNASQILPFSHCCTKPTHQEDEKQKKEVFKLPSDVPELRARASGSNSFDPSWGSPRHRIARP
jgi:hypothetical protein